MAHKFYTLQGATPGDVAAIKAWDVSADETDHFDLTAYFTPGQNVTMWPDGVNFVMPTGADVGTGAVFNGVDTLLTLPTSPFPAANAGLIYFDGIVDNDSPVHSTIISFGGSLGSATAQLRKRGSGATLTMDWFGSDGSEYTSDQPRLSVALGSRFQAIFSWYEQAANELFCRAYANLGSGWIQGAAFQPVTVADFNMGRAPVHIGHGSARLKGTMFRTLVGTSYIDPSLTSTQDLFSDASGNPASASVAQNALSPIIDLYDAATIAAGTNHGSGPNFAPSGTWA